jgi:protein phosphatase methylesterase 1
LGYVVLDIVEQTALEALSSMAGYLRTRPSHFPSVEAGIEWHLRSGGLKVPESARVSVPPLLVADYHHDGKVQYDWRTNLGATSPWWNGWFEGLSKRFLQSRGGKLLLLAGTERLDKEMMIGQMQGKYALQIFPEAGHFLHEDCAEKTAQSIIEFYKRNDRSALVLPPKVSDMLKAGKKV